MPEIPPAYHFASPVLKLDSGLKQHYLPIPQEIAEVFREAGIRRVVATLNGYPVRRAIQGTRDGERFVMLSIPLLREIGAQLGDMVMVDLEADPEPDLIDLGEEFKAALDQDEAAAARFYAMNPGDQRSLASYVTSAKRAETRIKRALELAHKLRTYTLYGDLNGYR